MLCIVSNYEVFINCYRKNYSSCLFTKTASNNCFNSSCAFIWTVLHPRTYKAQVQSNAPSSAQCLWELLVWPAIWPVFINQNTFIFRDIERCCKYCYKWAFKRFILCQIFPITSMTLFDRVTVYMSWFSKHPSLNIRPCMLCCDYMCLESQDLKQAILKFLFEWHGNWYLSYI